MLPGAGSSTPAVRNVFGSRSAVTPSDCAVTMPNFVKSTSLTEPSATTREVAVIFAERRSTVITRPSKVPSAMRFPVRSNTTIRGFVGSATVAVTRRAFRSTTTSSSLPRSKSVTRTAAA